MLTLPSIVTFIVENLGLKPTAPKQSCPRNDSRERNEDDNTATNVTVQDEFVNDLRIAQNDILTTSW